MIIRCWGARGSIPVSGKEYIKYGGNTSCVEIRTKDDQIIIIDAGSGIRELGNVLLKENRSKFNIIFTHAHLDHVIGLPFFKPLYMKDMHLKLFGCPFAQESIKKMISKTMSPPAFPVNFEDVQSDITYHGACRGNFSIGSVEIIPILTSHPNQGMGYKFIEDNRSFVFLTDNELSYKHPGGLDYKDYVDFSSDADLLLHDAEYTEEEYTTVKTWGHSMYKDALQLALDAKVKKFGLFHHNQQRTDAQIEKIVKDCQSIIEKKGSGLECFASYEGMEITI